MPRKIIKNCIGGASSSGGLFGAAAPSSGGLGSLVDSDHPTNQRNQASPKDVNTCQSDSRNGVGRLT